MSLPFKRPTPHQLVILGMTTPLVLMVLAGLLQWKSVRDYRTSRDWVTHTRIVLFNLESFLACINDAETGQRGYLLTHKENYLEPYQAALPRIPEEFQTLRQLTSDNQNQQKNLDRLEPLTKAKLNVIAQTIALERSGNHTEALRIVNTDFGKNTMDQIRLVLSDMHSLERGLLLQREESYQQTARINANLSLVLIVIGFGCVVAIIFLLRRLERAETMITICAWSKLIEFEGQWLTVEEYLMRRLNVRITHGISNVEAQKMLKLIEEEKRRMAA